MLKWEDGGGNDQIDCVLQNNVKLCLQVVVHPELNEHVLSKQS